MTSWVEKYFFDLGFTKVNKHLINAASDVPKLTRGWQLNFLQYHGPNTLMANWPSKIFSMPIKTTDLMLIKIGQGMSDGRNFTTLHQKEQKLFWLWETVTKFGLGTASILYKLTVCQFLNATIRSLKNFNIQEARRDAVCGISVKDSKLIIVNSISNFKIIFHSFW